MATKPRWVELTHVGYGRWARLEPGAPEVGYFFQFNWKGTAFEGLGVEGRRGTPVTGATQARTIAGKLGRLLVLPSDWRFLGVGRLGYNAKGVRFEVSADRGHVIQSRDDKALVIAPVGTLVRVSFSAYYKDGKRSRREEGVLTYLLTEEGIGMAPPEEEEVTFDL